MKNLNALRLLFAAMLVVAGFADSNAQRLSSPGAVIDVLDGKTAVVAVPGGSLNIQLQHIEVPAAGQPLHNVVRDHLKQLLVGRSIQFRTGGIAEDNRTVGQLFLNGIDVSRQLLRDGAAWLKPLQATGQDKAEYAEYLESEAQARTEKRGVWSGVDVKPPWEMRLEQAVAEIPPASEEVKLPLPEKKRQPSPWGDTNPWLKTPSGLAHGYNAATQTGFFGTTLLGVKETRTPDGGPASSNPRERTAVDITYVYNEYGEKGRKGEFVITIISLAQEWRFLAQNTLKVQVDGKEFVVAKPKREAVNQGYGMVEKLTYRVERSTIEKIALGSEVIIKVGSFWLEPTVAGQMILYNMLEVASESPRPAAAENRPVKNK